jgi:hypothetical protein
VKWPKDSVLLATSADFIRPVHLFFRVPAAVASNFFLFFSDSFFGDDPRRQRGAGQRQLSDAHRSTAMEISGARVSGGGRPATEGNELEEEEKVRIDSSTHKQIEREPGGSVRNEANQAKTPWQVNAICW